MLLNRIRDAVEPLLRFNQNGFRPGRGTREHILALRRIIEEAINHQLPVVMTFIDFSKAFDCILRSHLPDILAAYGIPKNIIIAIMSLYTNTKAKVLTPEGPTLEFLTNLGILQGDVLAPLIFIIVLDYILSLAIPSDAPGLTLQQRKSSRHPATKMSDLDFADDLVTLSNTIEENTELCQSIATVAARFGLLFNLKKTKYMTWNIPRPFYPVMVGDVQLEEVDDFKYLGSYIASATHDISVRKATTWRAMHCLDSLWKSDLSRKTKIKVFRTAVEPILLYGSETWTLTEIFKRSLDGFYTRMLRKVLNINWKTHGKITNKKLYGSIPPVSSTIRQRRLRFAGHIQRHDDQPVHKLIFWNPRHGMRYQGKPRLTYVDVLKGDTGLSTADEVANVMMGRECWRDIASSSIRTC